jgi:hypothetical protein
MIFILALVVVLIGIGALVTYHATVGAFVVATIGTSLLFGAPLFWLLIIAESSLLFWALDEETDTSVGVIETISLLAVLLILQFFSNVKVFTYIWAYPVRSVGFLALYLLVGGVWSIGKWWFAETSKFHRVKEEFLRRKNITGSKITEEFQEDWRKTVEHQKTNPRDQQSRFLGWIAYWPWSLFWTILNDPLKRAARRVYHELQATYQRITDHVWKVS